MSSADSSEATMVDREGVVPLRPRSPPTAPQAVSSLPDNAALFTPAYPSPAQVAAPSPADKAFVGTLAAITALLAARLLLLLAILGGFLLAWRAGDTNGLCVFIAYAILVVAPLVALDITTHKRGGK